MKNKKILAITNKNTRLSLARKYIKNVTVVDSFDSISWPDIILRRIRLISIPGKHETTSTEQRAKRTAAKYLGLGLSSEIARKNFEDCLFDEHGCKTLFAPGYYGVSILKKHIDPEFNILELKDELKKERMLPFFKKAEKAAAQGRVDEHIGLTIFTNPRDDINIRTYRKLHPKRKLIIRYHDSLSQGGLGSRSNEMKKIVRMVRDLRREKVVDGVESYCLSDAKLLGALYRPNGVDPNILKSIDCTFRERLYRFIGGSKDDSRLLPLKDIRTELFALYPAIGGWLEEYLAKIQTSWMSYDEYLEKSAKSEIFIDLVRVSQEEGFSFRIPEALFLNRKIITNRLIARDEPFYSPERVFLIGVDPVSRLKEFLEADLEPLPESILRFYNSRLWWTDQDPVKEFQEIMK